MRKNEVSVVFYNEHTDDPKSWKSPRPDFDLEKFNRELERRAGCIGSIPRYRCRWAPGNEEYLLEDYDVIEGYTFSDENGQERHVSRNDVDFEFPDNAIISPYYENYKVWIPRFVIEQYQEPFYTKAWMVENIRTVSKEMGKVEILSYYREPAEVDILMACHHAYLRQHLTDDQIRDGIAQMQAMEDAQTVRNKEEMIDDMAEETLKAFTDGVPNASKFGFDRNLKFDIKGYSKTLMKEHDKIV